MAVVVRAKMYLQVRSHDVCLETNLEWSAQDGRSAAMLGSWWVNSAH